MIIIITMIQNGRRSSEYVRECGGLEIVFARKNIKNRITKEGIAFLEFVMIRSSDAGIH